MPSKRKISVFWQIKLKSGSWVLPQFLLKLYWQWVRIELWCIWQRESLARFWYNCISNALLLFETSFIQKDLKSPQPGDSKTYFLTIDQGLSQQQLWSPFEPFSPSSWCHFYAIEWHSMQIIQVGTLISFDSCQGPSAQYRAGQNLLFLGNQFHGGSWHLGPGPNEMRNEDSSLPRSLIEQLIHTLEI